MIELSFDVDLYAPSAVEEAVRVYAEHARIEAQQQPSAWTVRVSADGELDEQLVADELANFALGATIERRRTR